MNPTAMTHPISGTCDPLFAPIRERFEQSFRDGQEMGAAVCITLHGRPVVDLWGGYADQSGAQPWEHDTLVNLYSTTKGVTALCALRLVEQGKLDLNAPVATYWPEFAAAGKQAVPVSWLLCHKVGLPAIRRPLPAESLYDWDAMCSALAAESPWWELDGETFGYHPVTFGWLVGEVVRRVSGRSLGRFFRDEFGDPLDLPLYIGVPEDRLQQCAEISMLAPPPELLAAIDDGSAAENPAILAFTNPLGTGDHNSEAYRRAEIPAINGHGSASALARLYGALANKGEQDGVHVLSPKTIELARSQQALGIDQVMNTQMRFGNGFWLGQPDQPGLAFGPNAGAFGHPGAGGSVAFADPENGLGFAYVMNRVGTELTKLDPRPQALIDAAYAVLGTH